MIKKIYFILFGRNVSFFCLAPTCLFDCPRHPGAPHKDEPRNIQYTQTNGVIYIERYLYQFRLSQSWTEKIKPPPSGAVDKIRGMFRVMLTIYHVSMELWVGGLYAVTKQRKSNGFVGSKWRNLRKNNIQENIS